MRLLNLYQVYDKQARTPIGPIVAGVTPTQIIREMQEHANNKESLIGKHPSDFVIIHIGEQDQDTGTIEGCEVNTVAEVKIFVNQT